LAIEKVALVDMEDPVFNSMFEEIISKVNEIKNRKAEEAEENRKAEIKAAEDRAKKEAEQKAENEKAEEEAKRKAEQDQKEAEQRAELEAKEKREKEEKYNAWLLENSYNADTDQIEFNNGISTLYRKVSEFKHE
jgi:Skp family chaperone for outer membrane proteins